LQVATHCDRNPLVKRLAIMILALLLLPALALAANEKFKGSGTGNDKRVDVLFDVQNEKRINGFTAKKLKLKCKGAKTLHSQPLYLYDKPRINSNDKFSGKSDKNIATFKVIAKVTGRLTKGAKTDRYKTAHGVMRFVVIYPDPSIHCETDRIKWEAEIR
jgi:hypothetical protein